MADCPECDGVGLVWVGSASPAGHLEADRCSACDGTGIQMDGIPPTETTDELLVLTKFCGRDECESAGRCAHGWCPDFNPALLEAERDAAKAAVDESLRVHQANVKRLMDAVKALKDANA